MIGSHFVRAAWRRMPVETVAVGGALAASLAVVHGSHSLWGLRVLLAALVAAPIAVATHALPRRWQRVTAAGAALGCLLALTLTVTDLRIEHASFAWPYGLALLAAVLLPFVAAARDLSAFVRRFFEQTTTWGLLWIGALAAVGVVCYALHELFGLGVDKLTPDALLLVTAGFVLTWLHALLPGGERSGRVPELWRRLATTIGAPFVSVMLVILVAYELLVLARGELPKNLLSPLVLAAGLVGYVCTLIIASVAAEPVGSATLAPADPHQFVRRLSVRVARAFPLVLLLLLPMAAWALFQRIDQYGLTPFRAVRVAGLLCLLALSVLGTLRWWRSGRPLSWEVPGAFAGVALILAFGPLSAVGLSVRSQASRLERLLTSAGVTARSVARDGAPVRVNADARTVDAVMTAIRDLDDLGGDDAVGRVLRGDVAECADSPYQCVEWLGLDAREAERDVWVSGDTNGPFALPAGDVQLIELEEGQAHPTGLALKGVMLGFGEAGVDLSEIVAATQGTSTLPARVVTIPGKGLLAITRLVARVVKGTGAVEITRLSGLWLPQR